VRDVICANKISGERWLEVARECHRQGVKTNATMLYGHVETIEERVDHLLRLRELQDETGGFVGLIPLAFHPENTPLAHLPASSGQTDLRVIAVSRLLFDNVPHIKAYWIQIGTKLAQIAMFFGADDLVGTVVDETITHAAGATTASGMTRLDFERVIRESGREPFERDSEYRRIVRVGPHANPVAETVPA
jgi:aminodeoxyfutalosine synthase